MTPRRQRRLRHDVQPFKLIEHIINLVLDGQSHRNTRALLDLHMLTEPADQHTKSCLHIPEAVPLHNTVQLLTNLIS